MVGVVPVVTRNDVRYHILITCCEAEASDSQYPGAAVGKIREKRPAEWRGKRDMGKSGMADAAMSMVEDGLLEIAPHPGFTIYRLASSAKGAAAVDRLLAEGRITPNTAQRVRSRIEKCMAVSV